MLGGRGGNNLIGGGKAGGGAVGECGVRNQVLTLGSDADAGGDGARRSVRAGEARRLHHGGDVAGVRVRVSRGRWPAGRVGGNGGDLTGLQLVRDDDILTNNATIDAGRGGDAVDGKRWQGRKDRCGPIAGD